MEMEKNPEAEAEDDAPSFFKFLADDSLDYLPICPAFVKKLLEGEESKYPKNPIFIMNEYNQTWTVQISQIGQKHCLVNGWLRFVEDNGLKTGDFIVFWLIAHSTFQVAIYGPSCCQKRSINPRIAKEVGGRSGHEKKKPKVEYEISGGSGSGSGFPPEFHPCCSRVIAKSHQYLVPLTSTFAREAGIERKKKVVLRDEKGKDWEVGGVMRNHSYYLTRGWFYFRQANKVEVGDTCLFTFPTPPPTPTETPLLDVEVLRKPKRKRGRPRVRASLP